VATIRLIHSAPWNKIVGQNALHLTGCSGNEQAIISPHSIDWLVCMTETECNYCRPVTSGARIWSHVSSCEICGGQKRHRDRFVSQYFCFPLSVSFRQCCISSSSTCCSYRKDKRAKPEDLPKNKVLTKIAEHWIKKYVHLFIPSVVMNTVVL